MAANDYYTNTSYTSHPHGRSDAPLPPLPHTQSQQSISPISSPFDDHQRYDYSSTAHLTHQQSEPSIYSDTSYQGAKPGMQNRPYDPMMHGGAGDPFADQNAIPLRAQGKLDDSPTRYAADPEGRLYPTQYPMPQKKKGWLNGRVTWMVFILTTVQICVFIGEIIKNGIETGSPIEIHPNFNPMIGPSPYILVNMGARYPPCMHKIDNITDITLDWPCPKTTSSNTSDSSYSCTLAQLCGMGSGVPVPPSNNNPDQWWRFITPIFLHAGIIHIGFNMLLQWTAGRDMEKEIGSLRFALVYFSAGIFGNVLGGNYAGANLPSTGASGALFGVLALVLLDLLYHWRERRSPVKDLLFLGLDFAISFVLGLLPGLDNFAHIGGFLMGLALGICLLHSPAPLRERIGVDEPPYASVQHLSYDGENSGNGAGIQNFVKQPVGFFKGRKPFWWAWWLIRAGALVAVFVGFILLLKNFYVWRNECSWCRHLSCLPIKNWCDVGYQFTSSSSNSKRDVSLPLHLALFAAEAAQ